MSDARHPGTDAAPPGVNDLRPIGDSEPRDVFICSYPRSGITWFQNLVAGVVHGVDPRFGHDSLIQDLVPDVHYKPFYKRYGPIAYFKSHFLPDAKYRRVVYLLRDGRDVMVSYWHFLSALQGPLDFLKLVEGHGLSPCHWHEHVEAWLGNPHGADMIVIRYEDLRASPVRELKRFCDFAGLEREDAYLDRIAAHATFANARRKEVQQGWDNKVWPPDQPFVRRGVIGSHRDEMPPAVLAAFMQEPARRWRGSGIDAPLRKGESAGHASFSGFVVESAPVFSSHFLD